MIPWAYEMRFKNTSGYLSEFYYLFFISSKLMMSVHSEADRPAGLLNSNDCAHYNLAT
jgi:hypothetical protein